MDYLTVLLTVLCWWLYAMFVYQTVADFRRRQRQERERPRLLGLWLTLWAVFAGGLLVYFSVYPVGIAGMVWVAVNVAPLLPEMGERADESPDSDGRLMRAAVWMTLLSALCLVVGWPVTVLRPEVEAYKYIAVLVAGIASVMFILTMVAAWRRWRSRRGQANVTEH